MNVRGFLQTAFGDEEGLSLPPERTHGYDVEVQLHSPDDVKKFIVEDVNWEHDNQRLVIYVEELMI